MEVSAGPDRPDRLRIIALLNGGLGLITIGLATSLFSFVTESNLFFFVGPLAWAIAAYHGAFHAHISRDEFRVIPIATLGTVSASLVVTAIALLAGVLNISLSEVLVGSVAILASLIVGVFLGRMCLRSAWVDGHFRSTAVVAGSGMLTSELALELRHRRELGIDLVEFVDLGLDDEETDVSAISDALRRLRPDRLIIGETALAEEALLPVLRFAGTIGTRVYVLPRLFSMGGGNPLFSPDQLRGFPLQRVNRSAHPRLSLLLKRALDIAVSAGVLLAASPLLIAVGVLVKTTSPGPLLFWQERLGLNGETIRIAKFRSMRTSETSDFEWTADNRITPIGRFLRRSAIDELPQLWSVLRGDMSLVGPRPERPAFATQFAMEHAEYDSRHRMTAGLTGLAQIAGLRGDTSIGERAKYDNLYIDQWSLSGDLMILFRTVGAIVGERTRAEAQITFEEALSTLSEAPQQVQAQQLLIDVDETLDPATNQEQSRRSIHA